MPVTITLGTIPGAIERGDQYSAKTMELFGPSLGREMASVTTVGDIRAAVMGFGHRLRAAYPDASFQVSISLRKGDRKPRGYGKAYARNGFGQEAFLRVVDKRTRPTSEPSGAVPATADDAADMGCEP